MFPYADFLLDFERKHGDLTHRNSPENTRAAVIVETRPDFWLPRVIRNVMYFLGPRWNLYIFCREESGAYVQAALPGWDVWYRRVPGDGSRLPRGQYNQLMTFPGFWASFAESKLLVFQADSLLSSPDIDEFLDYDFIGGPWGRFDEFYYANGGLSLRTRDVMLECLERFPFPLGTGVNEDGYFTSAVRRLGRAMPDFETATRFAVESVYTAHPVGVHATNQYRTSLAVARQITQAIPY
jgi:Protein of unknown function (DUF5672)